MWDRLNTHDPSCSYYGDRCGKMHEFGEVMSCSPTAKLLVDFIDDHAVLQERVYVQFVAIFVL